MLERLNLTWVSSIEVGVRSETHLAVYLLQTTVISKSDSNALQS